MKKNLLLFVLLLFAAGLANAQDWRAIDFNMLPSINDAQFFDADKGYAVTSKDSDTDEAYFLTSVDGGITWTKTPHITKDINLSALCFIDEDNGYIGGADAALYKTNNGGASWDSVDIPGQTDDVEDIYFADMNTGWVLISASSGATIQHTSDGGASWTTVLTTGERLYNMSFADAQHGVATGKNNSEIYYTADGTSWNAATPPQLGMYPYTRSDLWAVEMVNQNIVYASGWGSSAAGLQPTIHIKSTDGGATWTYLDQSADNKTYANMTAMTFKDENTGLTGGAASMDGTIILKTTDGGTTWYRTNTPYGFSVETLTHVGDKVWAVGSNGMMAYSEDFGDSWQLVQRVAGLALYQMQKIDANIYATGYDGAFLKSDDGGETWDFSYVGVDGACPNVFDMHFVDNVTGFVSQNYGMVSKTTDGGETWTPLMEPELDIFQSNYGIYFLDENNGFVVGRNGSSTGAFYKTNDGGENWSELIAFTTDDIRDIWAFDQNNLVLSGDKMILMYSEDGGDNWNNATVNNLPAPAAQADIIGLKFLDGAFGVAAGDVVLKTNDGGKTWDYVNIEGLEKEMKNAAIVSADEWYVTGDKFLYKTTDGGATWTNIYNEEIMGSSLYAVVADDSQLWAAGYNSAIYTTSPEVSVEEEDAVTPESFAVSANYPNPFNPSTKVNFTVTEMSVVKIKVYDALGRLVNTLMNETKAPGSYTVTFDASELTSGIYFLNVESAGNIVTRKMTLLK